MIGKKIPVVFHMGDPAGLPGNKILEYAQPR